MKNRIHYTPEARRDLDDIWDYIVSDLQNHSAAESTVNRIMDAVDKLEKHALIGTPLSSITNVDSDYRFLVSGNYMIFYRTNGDNIYIDCVLHGRRDYMNVLFKDLLQEESTE